MTKTENFKKETLLYVVIWILIFLSPVASAYFHAVGEGSDLTIKWNEIAPVWYIFAIYLVIFVIHNYILAPLLIYRHKRVLYFVSTACLLMVFCVWQCLSRPVDEADIPKGQPRMEMAKEGRPRPEAGEGRHEPPGMPGRQGTVPPPKPANDLQPPKT